MKNEVESKMKKVIALLLVIVMSVTVLAGCAAQQKETAEKSGESTATESGESTAAKSGTPTTNILEDGRTQVTGVSKANVQSLYPFGGPADDSNPWKWQAYEFLFIYNPTSGELESQIAKDYTVSEDGLEYEIEIYDYVYDSAGNHITAEDVVFCMQTAFETGNFTNLGMNNMESIEATGDYTVKMKFSSFIIGAFEFIMEYVPIVSQKAYEESGDEMATAPISTSPYKVTNFVSGSSVTMEKRDDYWQTDESLLCTYSQSNVDVINLQCIAEISQRKVALQSGTVDAAPLDTESAVALKGEGYREFVVNWPHIQYFQLSKDANSPFSDENFRKAVLCAIDRDGLIEAVYGEYAEKAVLGIKIAEDFDEAWLDETYPYEYDVEKAKEYLGASDYGEGTKIRIVFQSDDVRKKIAEILQAYLSQIGIIAEVVSEEPGIYADTQRTPANYDLTITQKYGLYSSKIYNSLFDVRNYSSGTTLMGLKDDNLQALIETACAAETNSVETANDVRNYVTEHALVGPLCWLAESYVVPADSVITELVYWDCGLPVYGACTYDWGK
ncbi:ABC transporter substrate-binding protein [Ruminococcus gauvreauii]|uniref:ABC transporter substrate-binding protein n=1 Tax=Ruminococcus gauvreauii TaxID=438033 RepID=A0ABY5VD51_9FIRM|nr:ABC transporter substrate-binding protein [Ruminococcus gauvreauii]UWP58227.1 ABC transporter substrate-binding protein [Ruminococcus gauvreauii]